MNTLKNWLMVLFVAVCSGAYAQQPDLDVPYVPTKQETVEEMLKLAGVKPGDVVYDLGCGDGRIVITAAQKFGATGVGVDLNPQRIKEANANAKAAGVTDKVRFVEGNLFDFDFSKANVVTMYLLPSVNLKLRPKLQKELKPGSRIVSHDFDMGDWPAEKTIEVGSDTIYLWTIGN
ncbi:Methyltransferase domain-containing protein [Parapedobacter luteus]|uniref:Methyltransferase domain-containing protein n=1 Tax=Parapedobacter luteus TaxID=623280 RepID=A0A1T5AX07_9SPHI|nr:MULTISPECIES: class I SAM-dependent methyltransferase [Parapedobacter]SKB39528.1 Methyltransferase domain-containing protein [Parapedobacter luteus]